MTVYELQHLIKKLRRKTNTIILAHSYQSREIVEVADFSGDSFALSKYARDAEAENILLCGVRFMAETAKILNPDKRVYLANPRAGCVMAEQLDPEQLLMLKQMNPDYTVVGYINTTAALKQYIDVCVTSSSAVDIVKNLASDKILFIPDENLADFVRKQCPDKDIKTFSGGCPIHYQVTAPQVKAMRRKYPGALVLVHPECRPAVCELADYVGSTSGIMAYARQSDKKEFIIGTESGIASHLQYECPDKRFYPLTKRLICENMRITTLPDVYAALSDIKNNSDEEDREILLGEDVMEKAGKCVLAMLTNN